MGREGEADRIAGSAQTTQQQQTQSQPENLWNAILSEASRSISDRLETRTVIVLGDRKVGKSTLLARLQGIDAFDGAGDRAVALDYAFIDIFSSDADDDPVARLNVWQLDGDEEHKGLLRFVANASTLVGSGNGPSNNTNASSASNSNATASPLSPALAKPNSNSTTPTSNNTASLSDRGEHSAVVIVCVDASEPWHMVASLRRWLGILEEHIKSTLSPETLQQLQKNLAFDYQQYVDPTVVAGPAGVGPKTPKKKSRQSLEPSSSFSQVQQQQQQQQQELPPLGDGVLTNNLGVPIIVVATKTDMMAHVEKEYGYKDAHWEFVQQYLRRICLSYGAALVYASPKQQRNTSLLMQYVRHVLYGLPITVATPASAAAPEGSQPTKHQLIQTTEKDTVFVPAGADTLRKISIDFEAQSLSRDPNEAFEEVIKVPKTLLQQGSTIEPMTIAEDDQDFLAKHKDVLEQEPAQDPNKQKRTGLLSSLQKYGSTVSQDSPPRASTPPTSSPDVPHGTTPASGSPTTAQAGDPKAPSANEHQVLADFFNSLIHKDRSAPLGARKPAVTAELAKTLSTSSSRLGGLTSASSREDVAKQLERLRAKPKE